MNFDDTLAARRCEATGDRLYGKHIRANTYGCPWCEAPHLTPVKPLPRPVTVRYLSWQCFVLGLLCGGMLVAAVTWTWVN